MQSLLCVFFKYLVYKNLTLKFRPLHTFSPMQIKLFAAIL